MAAAEPEAQTAPAVAPAAPAAEAGAAPLPAGWTEHKDPSSGNPYWFHGESEMSVWERPTQAGPPQPGQQVAQPEQQQTLQPGEAAAPTSTWTRHVDANTGLPYWFNNNTHESTWTQPAELEASTRGFPMGAYGGHGTAAMGGYDPSVMGGEVLSGRVKAWRDDRGFGFILQDNGGEDLFVNRAVFAGASRDAKLALGEQVFYPPPIPDARNPAKMTVSKLWGPAIDIGPSPGMLQGTVKAWRQDKGFGFVTQDAGGEDLFVNRAVFAGGSRDAGLIVGKKVYYDPPIQDPRKPDSITTTRVQGPGVCQDGFTAIPSQPY
eukprot:TRINITY_DN1311_c0_g1_i1.p1 TRINITY_DN1311_c0_g1~~TRINITY_DN1311_c0_g1_i1.p1  ORF type:complete len:320 (+),score=56.37 TRINITY_DN1311_c0_g1_i1:88-1047(+)